MKWYTDYLSTYENPYSELPPRLTDRVKKKIKQLQAGNPLVSVVVIAHNEESRIFPCLWSISENQCLFCIEIIVVNNHSTDNTENILKELGVRYYNEEKKGPGFARQCGLNYAKGKYCLCMDSDTIYPPFYIATMTDALRQDGVVAAYALWSFLPNKDYSPMGLFLYEAMRDIYFNIQHIQRPELNVRGMVFGFRTNTARQVGFRTDIIRGEDGSLALELKEYGRIKFVKNRKARAITGYGTISADGSLFNSFRKRAAKGFKNLTSLFHSKEKYEDEDSNLIK